MLHLLWRLALAEAPQPAPDGPTATMVDALFRYDAVLERCHLEHECAPCPLMQGVGGRPWAAACFAVHDCAPVLSVC